MTGVNACSEDGNAVFFSDLIKFSCEFRILSCRECHLFCGSDNVDLLLEDVLHLRECFLCEGVCAKKNDISSAGLDDGFVLDDDVRSVASLGLDVVIHGSTDLLVSSNYSYDLNAFLVKKHVSHAAAH